MNKLSPRILLFSVLTSISILGGSCQSQGQNKMEEKFAWTATLSAPAEYPIEIYKGELSSADYDQNFKDWGIINPGWGNMFGTVVSGPTQKAAPDNLKVTWLSFAEKKFFSGNFELPKDKIASLLQQGFKDENDKQQAYTNIVIGFAPKGLASIWVMGAGKRVLVAQFHARETTIDPKSVESHDTYMFREGYIERTLQNDMIMTDEVKQKIAVSGNPDPSKYEKHYNEKFSWKPSFELYENGSAENFGFTTFNGEMDKLFGESLTKSEAKSRAVPKECFFYWKTDKGEKHAVKVVSFDENEIYEAFHAVGETSGRLVFKVASGNKVDISLKTDSKEIALKKSKVKSQ
ncbi:DUF2931 family protein [Flavobacterium sp.]|uniref:DUF2931 family protein n=1 Tax=Flavobacterium sp. TaxID=239 RepID=UPI00121E3B81|nr:DUF2931 family protein [Flavobacterium sp.]RZJ70723.1 MAG: DUF2931 family protein [Flavobacterium sp.]